MEPWIAVDDAAASFSFRSLGPGLARRMRVSLRVSVKMLRR
jgi:hypothetical protein